ncbi:MAG: HTH-type transcriptional regulator CymR [Syntrophaceae bacterium PtaU1.Bin231]|jgi:Rrf2 family protein|nr:MAG: HTH-type transcriptional regulator CymR [Syntrophaceae bacterium PtaB.Bin038]OPY87485.1 MAG: HTH-type transcriptional regulator CymR [Syntrophaceae bacterium PtaU1.Bin231]
MKISAKARYGVRLMMVLARNYGSGPIFLKDIAKKEEISEKYLGQIVIPLRGAGLVLSSRGAHGGYMLAREPSEINLKQIVDILEGDCLVRCIKDPSACTRVRTCASRDIWMLLGGKISETLGSVSLAELNDMGRRKMATGRRRRIMKRENPER